MPLAAELEPKKEIAAYVRFQRRAVEDKRASSEAGRYVAKDVDYALITPPYSRDVIEIKVDQWVANMENDVRNSRLPPEWQQNYLRALDAWRNGQEIPLHGTPIRGWGVISPAQQETLLRINILTVEDLAGINDEGARRIGMGAIEMKSKALNWLKQLKDKGPLVQENADLRREVEQLRSQVAALREQNTELRARDGRYAAGDVHEQEPEEQITAAELLDDDKPRRQRTRKAS